MEFAGKQRLRVRQALEGRLSPSVLSPAERHQFVHHYNYDDGIMPLREVAESTDTDRGTALLLYWMLQPGFFVDHDPQEHEQEQFDLIRMVEGKLLNGFYTDSEIGFEPDTWIAEYTEATTSAIDSRLRDASPGLAFDAESLEPSYLRASNAVEHEEVADGIAAGTEMLEKAGIAIPDDPRNLIDAIVKFITAAVTENRRPRNIKQLGWLWSDALRKSGDWDWATWCDTDSYEGNVVLLSADHRLLVMGPGLAQRAASGHIEAKLLRALFFRLLSTTDVERIRALSEEPNIVIACGNLPYH